MKVYFETKTDDFPGSSIKILTTDTQELFELGVLFGRLCDANLKCEHGTTDDKKGKFIRFPMIKEVAYDEMEARL